MSSQAKKPSAYRVTVYTGQELEEGEEMIEAYEYLSLKDAENHINRMHEDRHLYSPKMMTNLEYLYPE